MGTDLLNPNTLRGFVENCLDRGLTADQTESLFRKAAANLLMAIPAVQEGLQSGLTKAAGLVGTRQRMQAVDPEVMATVVETRLRFGDDPLSMITRKQSGWAPPKDYVLNDALIKAASQLSATLHGYEHLPLNQQLLLATILGGGAGAAYRAFRPTNEDAGYNRGTLNRAVRGAGRGMATGAGAAAGAVAGGMASNSLAHGRHTLPMMGIGAMLGGAGANHLAGSV